MLSWKQGKKTYQDKVHGLDNPYDMYWNVTVDLKVESVYKQGKN